MSRGMLHGDTNRVQTLWVRQKKEKENNDINNNNKMRQLWGILYFGGKHNYKSGQITAKQHANKSSQSFNNSYHCNKRLNL